MGCPTPYRGHSTMSKTTYQIEKWADCWDEMEALWDAFSIEAEIDVSPDNAAYELLDETGVLILATMRVDDELVGIYRSVLGPDLHNRGKMYAVSDGWFIHPHFRSYGAARRLLACAMERAKQKGAHAMYQSSSLRRPIDRLLVREGWKETERLFRIELEDA